MTISFNQIHQDDLATFAIDNNQYIQIQQQLPDKKFYEYVYHKFYNPDCDFDSWKPCDEWNWPVQDLLRFKYILLDNCEHIKNKKIADIGCHLGYMTWIMNHLGANQVTGTNVRSRELNLAKELCQRAGCEGTNFVLSDVHNYNDLLYICNQHDTVLLSGLLYHVTDQLSILETVTKSSAKSVIIDIREDLQTGNSHRPIIVYRKDHLQNSVDGWSNNIQDQMIVGHPNQAWINFAMEFLNWTLLSNKSYLMNRPHTRTRHVSVWTRVHNDTV